MTHITPSTKRAPSSTAIRAALTGMGLALVIGTVGLSAHAYALNVTCRAVFVGLGVVLIFGLIPWHLAARGKARLAEARSNGDMRRPNA